MCFKLSPTEYRELQDFIGEIDNKHNLSKKIKDYLTEDDFYILKKLYDKNCYIGTSNLSTLINAFFKSLNFDMTVVNRNLLDNIKNDISTVLKIFDQGLVYDDEIKTFYDNFFSSLKFDSLLETRGFYDLLMLKEFKDSPSLKRYLDIYSNTLDNDKIVVFTKIFYNIYSKLDEDNQKKVDYILNSSSKTLSYLINNSYNMSSFFSKRFLDKFSKEDLSLIFRNISDEDNSYIDDFNSVLCLFEESDDFLNCLAYMNNILLDKTHHNDVLFNRIISVFRSESEEKLVSLLEEVYSNGNPETIEKLLFFIVEDNGLLAKLYNIDNLNDFTSYIRKNEKDLYTSFLGKKGLTMMQYGVFDFNENFTHNRDKEKELDNLKRAYLKIIYGLNYDNINSFISAYCYYLDDCSEDFLEEDRETFEILKVIKDIYNLNISDKEKINNYQKELCDYIKDNGLYKNNDLNQEILSYRANKMYMNTYHDKLYEPISKDESPLKFKMIVSSISDFLSYSTENNLEKDYYYLYNTSNKENNNGICSSFITNENLGIYSLEAPLLGYCGNLFEDVVAMGTTDIYSEVYTIDLNDNQKFSHFISADKLDSYTRYGYNELVFNRFIKNDLDNKIKRQPDFVVVYKVDDNYKDTQMYKVGKKIEHDFNLPLVTIDIPKIKQQEEKEILMMEDELFSSNQVNDSLVDRIVTRYMNNYSGSLILMRGTDEINYKDFSINGLNNFLDKVKNKMSDLTSEEQFAWQSSLNKVYEKEKAKNKTAIKASGWGFTLDNGEFYLDEINYLNKIEIPKKTLIKK